MVNSRCRAVNFYFCGAFVEGVPTQAIWEAAPVFIYRSGYGGYMCVSQHGCFRRHRESKSEFLGVYHFRLESLGCCGLHGWVVRWYVHMAWIWEYFFWVSFLYYFISPFFCQKYIFSIRLIPVGIEVGNGVCGCIPKRGQSCESEFRRWGFRGGDGLCCSS